MKQILLFLTILLPSALLAQEVEQSIAADSYHREGSTMIISFYVPKSDVPVSLQYNVKDVFFAVEGQAYRAESVTGEMQSLSPGKHTIYWEIGKDAPDLYSVSEINVVLKFTQDTYTRVQDWKRRQEQQEQQRILQEIRAQERRRVEDSIKQANREQRRKKKKEEKPKKGWKRNFPREQFGVVGSVGSSFYEENDGDVVQEWGGEALSWQLGFVYRSHIFSWLGFETGGLYSRTKFALNDNPFNLESYAFSSINIPLKSNIYFGNKLSFCFGYMIKYRMDAFAYVKGEDRQSLTDYFTKRSISIPPVEYENDDLFDTWGGGWFYGGEWRSENTAFSIIYQKDEREPFTGELGKQLNILNGTWWITYGFYF